MATPRKTQIEKIENVLLKHNAGPGITVDSISRMARVPRESVSKRVADLREEYKIYTNYRKIDGKRTAFYRLADTY
jgi:hypothetical protein